ncbi:hypothetical protein MRX96_010670 [Rhipicephalus microplus]
MEPGQPRQGPAIELKRRPNTGISPSLRLANATPRRVLNGLPFFLMQANSFRQSPPRAAGRANSGERGEKKLANLYACRLCSSLHVSAAERAKGRNRY